MNIKKRGGKRIGAGRKKSEPSKVIRSPIWFTELLKTYSWEKIKELLKK